MYKRVTIKREIEREKTPLCFLEMIKTSYLGVNRDTSQPDEPVMVLVLDECVLMAFWMDP